jgi:membrane protein DedA with SNARE-associated domain
MNEATHFLIEHSAPVLFGVVLLEQLGLPLPAMPWLFAAGALAATGRLEPIPAVTMTVLACLVADSAWFHIGRKKGKRVLSFLCKISLEPTCCVGRSEGFLARHAAEGLMVAKFLPWLGMVIPPLAGSVGMSYRRFLLFDGIGSMLYSSSGILLGFIFSEQLHQALALMRGLGMGAFALVLTLIVVYAVVKIMKWRRSIRGRERRGLDKAVALPEQLANQSGNLDAQLVTSEGLRST